MKIIYLTILLTLYSLILFSNPRTKFISFCFEFNSTDTITCKGDDESAKEQIEILAKALIDNPTMVIKLIGHCSTDEKSPKKLSLKRAETIKNILTNNYNINPDRIEVSGEGINKLLMTEKEIKLECKGSEEMCRAINRRVGLIVTRNDFNDKKH